MKDNKVFDFIKILVETGNTHYVDENNLVVQSIDDKHVIIPVNKKPMFLLVFNKDMKSGEHVILNPFVDQIGVSAEKRWFYSALNVKLGNFVKSIMSSLISKVLDKEDIDYDKLDLIEGLVGKIDSKLQKEINKIPPMDFCKIWYSKRERIAQLQCDLLDEDVRNDIKGIRKGTWEFIDDFILELFGEDLCNTFKYKAKVIGCPKTDAFLHVFTKALEALNPWIEFLLPNNPIDLGGMIGHIDHIEEYHKAVKWFVNTSVDAKEDTNIDDIPPWEEQTPMFDTKPNFLSPPPQMLAPPPVMAAANIASPPPMSRYQGNQMQQQPMYQQSHPQMMQPMYQQQQSQMNYQIPQQQMIQQPVYQQQPQMQQTTFQPAPMFHANNQAPQDQGYSDMDALPAPRVG